MDELAQRARRAAESILENESLTSDLGDAAAKPLLDWGIACAQAIAGSTGGLDEVQAEENMSPRLRAIRRMMRLTTKWVANAAQADPQERADLLTQLIEQAATVYGEGFNRPDEQRYSSFLETQASLVNDPPRMIADLLQWLKPTDRA